MRVVALDDGRRLRVDVEQVARHRLAPGEEVAEALVGRLEAHDRYLRARERAVRLLAIRPRSTAELRARLRRDRVPEEQMHAVIADLTASGYLDDLAFARMWVTSRVSSRPCGIQRLRWELREKGVAPALVEQAIREAHGEEDLSVAEGRYARALADRRLRAYRRLPPETQARRLAGLLQRRGFSSSTISRVLRTLSRGGPSEIADA